VEATPFEITRRRILDYDRARGALADDPAFKHRVSEQAKLLQQQYREIDAAPADDPRFRDWADNPRAEERKVALTAFQLRIRQLEREFGLVEPEL
jgi:hypothetical protein